MAKSILMVEEKGLAINSWTIKSTSFSHEIREINSTKTNQPVGPSHMLHVWIAVTNICHTWSIWAWLGPSAPVAALCTAFSAADDIRSIPWQRVCTLSFCEIIIYTWETPWSHLFGRISVSLLIFPAGTTTLFGEAFYGLWETQKPYICIHIYI